MNINKPPLASWEDEKYFELIKKEEENMIRDYYQSQNWLLVPRTEIRNLFLTKYKDGSYKIFISEDGYLIDRGQDFSKFKEEKETTSERSARRAKKIITDLIKNNKEDGAIFVTLTNGNQSTLTDEEFLRKIIEKLRNYKKRHNSNFKYILVAERHKNSGRVHLHGIFWGYPKEKMVYSGKVGKTIGGVHILKDSVQFSEHYEKLISKGWRAVYNLSLFKKNGFTNASFIEEYDKACSYMTKYVTKDTEKIFKQYYFRSNNLELPDYESYYCPMISKYFKETGDFNKFEDVRGLYLSVSSSDDLVKRKFSSIVEKYLVDNYSLEFNFFNKN